MPDTAPETTQDPPQGEKKKRGRPPGSKNTQVKQDTKIPWFIIWRAFFWAAISVLVVVSLYRGVEGLLGQSAAYITLAVSSVLAGLLLDRDWKKMVRNG